MTEPLWTGTEWNPDMLQRTYDAIEKIAVGEMGLNIYPNQIEIITAEQMLDAYASIGMPIFYHHWSFGKAFSRERELYKAGKAGLAYEIVINSNPCINYLMEENTATMQALVMAHAAFGHNHFFKNNQLFRQWTEADAIIDYLVFAKNYIAECEERHGREKVETWLDSCHALQDYGVDRYRRPPRLSVAKEKERQKQREEQLQREVTEFYRIDFRPKQNAKVEEEKKFPEQPEENLLYFFEKFSPDIEPWQREILRIVRKIAQYFYPQGQTKVMNEGFATWVHYKIMNTLHERGLTTQGAHLEFLHSQTNVVFQPPYNSPYYRGINPYALGFEMFRDIERICTNPTDEDRYWFPNLPGKNPLDVILFAVENFRDESFIRQFLSPKLMRDWRMFRVFDRRERYYYEVKSIHDDNGFVNIRECLAETYEVHSYRPQIEVTNVDRRSRRLTLTYTPYRGRSLGNPSEMLRHVRRLWGGYDVMLVDSNGWRIME